MIYNIREYTRDDTAAMRSLWIDAFGDPAELIDRFFELLPSMARALLPSLTAKFSVRHMCWTHFCICPAARRKSLRISMPFPLTKVRRGAASVPSLQGLACETRGNIRPLSAARSLSLIHI